MSEKSSVQTYYETLEPKFESYRGIPCLCEPGLHQEIAKIVEELLPKESRILDVGCGRGALALRLHDQGFEMEGCDLFDLCECKEEIKFIHAAAEEVPFTGQYDAVLMIELLQAVESPYGVMRQYHELVKPGGYLIVSAPNVEADRNRVEYFLRSNFTYFEEHNVLNDGSIMPIFDFQIRHMVNKLGFEMVRRVNLLPHGDRPKVGASWAAMKLLDTYRQIAKLPRIEGRISCWIARRP